MKTLKITIIAIAASLALFACESADGGVGDDAARTPIGSVIRGETRTADAYLKRVEQENKTQRRDAWLPESPDRM